jgi:hypothetical protein
MSDTPTPGTECVISHVSADCWQATATGNGLTCLVIVKSDGPPLVEAKADVSPDLVRSLAIVDVATGHTLARSLAR